jgi:hypothetical protein
MTERKKLLLQILVFVLVVVLLAWALWVVFFKSSSSSYIPGIETQTPSTGLPQSGEGGSGRVIDQKGPTTLSPESGETVEEELDVVAAGGRTLVNALTSTRAEFNTLTSSGGFNYYNSSDEKFYRLQPGGSPVLLSDEVFRAVDNVAWSNGGESAILEFPDGSNIYYNFDTKQRATLPKEAQEFSFSQDDKELAYEYIGQAEDDRWIITSSPDGLGQQLIEPIGKESNNIKVDWSPNNKVVATYREPTSTTGEEVFFVGFNGENYLSLQTNGLGFEGKWSPKGKQILYSVFSEGANYNPVLHISGAEGDDVGLGNRSLQIQTWPDKCVFENENYAYCAVPQYLEEGAGIFREVANSIPDTIYKIDLINNISSTLAFPESTDRSSFTIDSINISDDGKKLYFTDRVSGRLHEMNIR